MLLATSDRLSWDGSAYSQKQLSSSSHTYDKLLEYQFYAPDRSLSIYWIHQQMTTTCYKHTKTWHRYYIKIPQTYHRHDKIWVLQADFVGFGSTSVQAKLVHLGTTSRLGKYSKNPLNLFGVPWIDNKPPHFRVYLIEHEG